MMAVTSDVISAIEGHFGERCEQGRTEPYEGRGPQLAAQGTNSPRDTEKNSVVIEREESVEAQASQRRDDRT